MEFVANEENLESFLVEGICLLVLDHAIPRYLWHTHLNYICSILQSAITKSISALVWSLLTSDHSFQTRLNDNFPLLPSG